MIDLNLDYPFHTHLMEPIKDKLIADLEHLAPADSKTTFISTVTGQLTPGSRLWTQPIGGATSESLCNSSTAIRAAAELGARSVHRDRAACPCCFNISATFSRATERQ